MKALLLKDFYMMSKYCRGYLLFVIVFLLSGFVAGNAFFYTYPCFLISLMPVSLYSYDEREGFCAYCMTLPFSRKQYIGAKYLLSIICIVSVLALDAILYLFKLRMSAVPFMPEHLQLLTVMTAVSFIIPAISMPLIFKLGPEKGRIAYLVMIGIACAVSTIAAGDSYTGSTPHIGMTASIVVSVLLYAVSWLLSVKIYEKKEL